ncbi:22925_t:CDS:2 [Dentiscutata erythropus]|uniref:22925_t:CDS:1 n=1 Tax=Dentiscutata erythropus TaxID=1348616 RepID=A0A9N9G3P3_9GLOM|nr:22925_t:CDS:2 [Dentiscutata erythropus]
MQKPFRDETPQVKEHEEGELFREETEAESINFNNGISDGVTNNNHEQVDDIEPNDEKYLCRFFQRGICRYNEGCRYSHQTNAPAIVAMEMTANFHIKVKDFGKEMAAITILSIHFLKVLKHPQILELFDNI